MTTKEIKHVPEPVLRRLPRYLQVLSRLKESGVKEVSSTRIADELSLDSTQVRKRYRVYRDSWTPKNGLPAPRIDSCHRIIPQLG